MKQSSIILQFSASLKYLDVNIQVLPKIQCTHTHTHANIHRLAVASWWLAQDSTTSSCPHSTGRRCKMSAFFSSLRNAEQTAELPFYCFKESRFTIADLPSLSVCDPKRSRSLHLNGVFCSPVVVVVVFFFLQSSALSLARNMAAESWPL